MTALAESLGDVPPVEHEQHWLALPPRALRIRTGQSTTAVAAQAAERLTARPLLAIEAETAPNGTEQTTPASLAHDIDALSSPQNRLQISGPAVLSLRSPSGLAAREDGEHDPKETTTLTIKNTETN